MTRLEHFAFLNSAAAAPDVCFNQCIPVMSVPCERLFSSSGYTVNKTHAALLPENVTSLVCLRNWQLIFGD